MQQRGQQQAACLLEQVEACDSKIVDRPQSLFGARGFPFG
jgi:hypothetical protein